MHDKINDNLSVIPGCPTRIIKNYFLLILTCGSLFRLHALKLILIFKYVNTMSLTICGLPVTLQCFCSLVMILLSNSSTPSNPLNLYFLASDEMKKKKNQCAANEFPLHRFSFYMALCQTNKNITTHFNALRYIVRSEGLN